MFAKQINIDMELTRAEEQIMQILWRLEKAFVKEIIEYMDNPKPAYNTVSTIIRILEKKHFVAHLSYGKTHQYFPLVQRNEYKSSKLKTMVEGYFNQSYKNLVSFFSKQENLSLEEMQEIKQLMEDQITKLKEKKES